MFEALCKTLEAGLSLWGDKEANKYVDRLIALKKKYYEEYNKPLGARSDAVLDNIEFELRVLATSFSSGVRKPDVTH